ncbi:MULTISPECIES: Dyp-type peroxidase [Vibrio]|uniref:Dyp-type peroxidase n=1 Tax=Vibrio chanodichtyis TaxID=3027932 RepID=A0ABT5V098_9VIBR|nr:MULTISPECIES: Dyp-type peroxidase [Vibrio]MDE1514517.1 Dyp-type peroxidase [Vibrio chanodichtyis]
MFKSQTAILPEAGPFALYTLIKVRQNVAQVLSALQALPQLVAEINQQQPGAELAISIAFSQSFWQHFELAPPPELITFAELGTGEIHAPSSEVDILIHCHSTRHDLLFFALRKGISEIAEDIEIIDETYGFRYLDARDMTGFIDGTENPQAEQRAQVALVAEGEFAGGSYVLVQRFVHNLPAWNRLNLAAQEKVIGRTKADSVELEQVPAASHVGRVDIKQQGKGLKIVRHSLPYGSVSGEHGLLFMAYCHTLHNLHTMLESMYGVTDGKTDQLLRFTKAVTGAYLFAPSSAMLQALTLKQS